MKRKVLFLLEAFDKGGIEKVTLDIVNNLDPQKYDITVQTFWWGGHCQSQVHDNVKVLPFFFRRYVKGIIRLIDYLSPKMLYRLFVKGKYDIEIAASDGGAAKVISGSTNKKSKKICWVHMDVVERGSGLKEYTNPESARKIYGKFDKIVCVSKTCKDKFIHKFGEYDIETKYNPLPVDEIKGKAEERVALPDTEGFQFVCVGRLVEQKGFDRLLEACSRLLSEGMSNFHISIVGEGPKRAELEAIIENNKLEKCITLLGFKENPYPYVKNADAFLLSSRDEAFPLAVGESLIIGTPVIATECSGIREWLGYDEKYGIVVENSAEGIYTGIKRILDNPEMLNTFRKNMPEKQKNIDFNSTLKEFEELLND